MTQKSLQGAILSQRVAMFVDGWNFKYATYDAFGIQVDFKKMLDHFASGSILVRAYYYTGEWDDEAIGHYIDLVSPADPEAKRAELTSQRETTSASFGASSIGTVTEWCANPSASRETSAVRYR